MTVGAPADAKGITVRISVSRVISLRLSGAGWSCSPPPSRPVSTYTCTTDDSSPAALVAIVKFHPHHGDRPSLSASVSAPGNDDPVSSNNSASLDVSSNDNGNDND